MAKKNRKWQKLGFKSYCEYQAALNTKRKQQIFKECLEAAITDAESEKATMLQKINRIEEQVQEAKDRAHYHNLRLQGLI